MCSIADLMTMLQVMKTLKYDIIVLAVMATYKELQISNLATQTKECEECKNLRNISVICTN